MRLTLFGSLLLLILKFLILTSQYIFFFFYSKSPKFRNIREFSELSIDSKNNGPFNPIV